MGNDEYDGAMDLGTMGNGRVYEDDHGGQEGDSSGHRMRLKGGKGEQKQGQKNGYCYPVWTLGTHGKEVRGNSHSATTVDSGDMWKSRALTREQGSKERVKARENTRRKESRQRLVKEPERKRKWKRTPKHERIG